MKQCKKCLVTKEPSYFYKSRTGSQGLHDYCKSCMQEYQRTYVRCCRPKIPSPVTPGNKVCTLCRKELPGTPEFFAINKALRSGLRCVCRSCYRIRLRRWKHAAKRKLRPLSQAQIDAHRRTQEYWNIWWKEHPEALAKKKEHQREVDSRYRLRQRFRRFSKKYNVALLEVERLFKLENVEELCKLRKKFNASHRPPIYKIVKRFRKRLSQILYYCGIHKSKRILRYLGCSRLELKQYLESQFFGDMSWDNYGTVWVIDHIKPLAAFDYSIPGELEKAWHFTNLRPFPKRDNILKSSRWNGVRHRYKKIDPAPLEAKRH